MMRFIFIFFVTFFIGLSGFSTQASDDFLNSPAWSEDVLINSRASVQQTCLKFYRKENRLFAILRIIEAEKSKLSVNMSADFGSTWEETWFQEFPGIQMRDMDATIYNNPFSNNPYADTLYVAYTAGELQKWIVLRKFSLLTGENQGIAGARLMDTPIKEVAMVTDPGDVVDLPSIRAVLLMEPTGLKGLVYEPQHGGDVTWENFPEHESQNAERGLDFSMYRQWADENYLTPRFFISYISNQPLLCLLNNYHTENWSDWQVREFDFANASLVNQNKYTTVSCHSQAGLGCTTFLASECHFNTGFSAIKYFVKYRGKKNWQSNDLGTHYHFAADAVTREDHAIGVVYNQLDADFFNHKTIFRKKWMIGGGLYWTEEKQINDHICNPRIQPSLEWIYAKKQPDLAPYPAFGVAYVAEDSMAYFDLSNQVYVVPWDQMPQEWKQVAFHKNDANKMTLTFPSATSAFTPADDGSSPWPDWPKDVYPPTPPVWCLGNIVAVFDPRGEMCGYGTQDGTDLEIEIAGDNLQTTATDGMATGEQFTIQVFNPDSNVTYALSNFTFSQGANEFRANASVRINSFEFAQHSTGLKAAKPVAPADDFSLAQNYPNPFNPETTISYALSASASVELTIFDIRGREVKRLVAKEQMAGNYNVNWHGQDSDGQKVASGIYFYRIQITPAIPGAATFTKIRKMILVQ